MAQQEIQLEWMGDMAFQTEIDGHTLVVDASAGSGGGDRGPRPKTLMLVALAGCTGMDVVSILKKMRVEVESFYVRVVGEITDEHPKHYTAFKVIYEFKGPDLPMDKLEKAVNLSEERYCGVSASYRKSMQVSTEIRIL